MKIDREELERIDQNLQNAKWNMADGMRLILDTLSTIVLSMAVLSEEIEQLKKDREEG